MGAVKEWMAEEQFCTVCGRGFLPLAATHKFDIMRPTCSLNCQEEFDHLMEDIYTHQRSYFDIDDNNEWDG